MGADLLVYVLEMDKGEEPDWEAARRKAEEMDTEELLDTEYRFYHEEGEDSMKEMLMEDLETIEMWWTETRPRNLLKYPLRHTEVLITGGMSWGDLPTESAEVISRVMSPESRHVLEAAGFN